MSTHASSHTPFIQLRHAILEHNLAGAWNYLTVFRAESDWVRHFLLALDAVEQNGGIAHLYLHSWEIAQWEQWTELEVVFRSISNCKQLSRVTNGELYRFWNTRYDQQLDCTPRGDARWQ